MPGSQKHLIFMGVFYLCLWKASNAPLCLSLNVESCVRGKVCADISRGVGWLSRVTVVRFFGAKRTVDGTNETKQKKKLKYVQGKRGTYVMRRLRCKVVHEQCCIFIVIFYIF